MRIRIRYSFRPWIRDPKQKNSDPGWKIFISGVEKIRIRDKHPGSATLHKTFFFFNSLYYPLVAETMIMMRMTATTTPMMIIILMFCHQYFRFSLVAQNNTNKENNITGTLRWFKKVFFFNKQTGKNMNKRGGGLILHSVFT